MKFVDATKRAGADVGIDRDKNEPHQQWTFEHNGELAILIAHIA